jgi:N-acetyl-beta-hexosaminidase
MAYHKMNRFHWHLCDDQGWRFPVPSWPLLTRIGSHRLEDSHGGHYTESDIQRIVERAHVLQITIVPEVELPGHCMAALASYPHLGCTRSIRNVPSAWGIYEGAPIKEFNIIIQTFTVPEGKRRFDSFTTCFNRFARSFRTARTFILAVTKY